MIDLHCHMIPWVDDGAKNAEVACQMAAHAYRNGVDTVVLTPHCNLSGARPNYRGRTYTEVFSLFRALLRQHGTPLQVLPGAELFAHPSNLRQLLQKEQIVTLNHSRYLLTEFRFSASAKEISQALDLIASYGLVPVVAHPERYAAVQDAPRLAVQWFSKGYILQVNKGSLLGRLGASAEQTALELLAHGLIHVIASDAHDTDFRPSGFQSLLPFLRRRCPEEYIRLMLRENPQRIISDQIIPIPGERTSL